MNTVYCIFIATNKIVYLKKINISVFIMELMRVHCEVGNKFLSIAQIRQNILYRVKNKLGKAWNNVSLLKIFKD